MNKINSTRPASEHILIYGLFILALLFQNCKPAVEKSSSEKIQNLNGRNDSWSIVGFGGGGAMFNPAVSPFDVDYAYVSCDMRQSFVTYNGGDSWRMFCLRNAVNYYVFDPLDTNTVYANSIGLFRSKDKGNTWEIAYPPSSDVAGYIMSGDEASEYIFTTDSTKRNVLAFAVDPANSAILYAAISIDDKADFYVSRDSGLHWNKEKDLKDGAKNIFVVPSSRPDNRTIYVAGNSTITTKENGIWSVSKGPDGVSLVTQYAGGFDQKKNLFIIYALSGLSYFNPSGDKSGIFFTSDGGRSWENRQDGLANLRVQNSKIPEWRCIATSAFHPEYVYISYAGLKAQGDTTCIGVAKSEDYGKTWSLSLRDCLTKDGFRYSSNYTGGWLDERFGPEWGENPFSIGISPAYPDVCYATDFGRTIKTSDGGNTWQQLYTRKKDNAGWVSRGLDVTTGYSVVVDPFDLNHRFLTTTDVGMMESTDGGKSWNSATKNNGIPGAWQGNTYQLVFDPDIKGRAWAVMSGIHDLPRYKMWRRNGVGRFNGGVLETENSGKSWKVVSQDIGEAAMTHILIDPSSNRESRTLYACAFGKGVYKSVDGGLSWQQKNNGIEGTEPLTWSMVRKTSDGTLFLLVNRKSDHGKIGTDQDGALYRSVNGAETWMKVALPAEANSPTSLLVDPGNQYYLVLSTWGRTGDTQFSQCSGGGIYISKDDGKNWKSVFLKDQFIHELTYDPRNKRYYACGFSSSAYWSDDMGETWTRIKGYNHKLGRRVDLDPENPGMIYISSYGGGVWYGPAKGDPNAIEDIITPALSY